MLIQHFQMLARYNTLANQKLYEVCSQLSDAERKRIRPAFFKSIHGTLNHIMLGDRIWMGRFEGKQMPSTGLDAILYDNFDELWKTRVLEDEKIEAFVSGLKQDFVTKTISYVNNAGKLYNDPANLLLAHFFNHQTHHRGQIHDMLTQTEIAPPSLDMHRVIRP
ncbi:DinB family protein [Mastigocladopsis repens]|uniref:DinB family protein n=1 Tax=Mastigocladopsis repens TaxID=221287 RepID=UPI0002DA0BE3|nr:DinB family protein [Mastigocladopsis repens]